MGRSAVLSSAPLSRAVEDSPFDEHLAAVFGLARQVTGDDDAAASVTKDVFGQLRHLGPNATDTLAACLLTETHRASVRWVRDARNGQADAATAVPTASALAALPPQERDVIADAFFGGYTYAEIARRRGLDAPTVARLLRDGLLRLRQPAPSQAG